MTLARWSPQRSPRDVSTVETHRAAVFGRRGRGTMRNPSVGIAFFGPETSLIHPTLLSEGWLEVWPGRSQTFPTDSGVWAVFARFRVPREWTRGESCEDFSLGAHPSHVCKLFVSVWLRWRGVQTASWTH